ncbi:MAG: metalloregulator ArsR/SmtB family transcription factor [Pseudomonadota bacterium]
MTNHLNAFFGALSDPTRRAVIERLAQGPAPVSELHAVHDIALPTFLKHIKVLETAGLVRSEKSGRVRTVHIEAGPLAEAETWLKSQRRHWEARLDRLGVLAERMSRNEKGQDQ